MNKFATGLLIMLTFSACSTYQYTARQTNVQQRGIDSKEMMVGVNVDYSRQVTATSDYQFTKNDAVKEAEFRCIQDSKIDVVIDPIYKMEYNPLRLRCRYKATIIGYAGMYEKKPAGVESTKEYTREEIENYKLLNDPTFPQYFYNQGEGDRYFFHSNMQQPEAKRSLLLQPAKDFRANNPAKTYDYAKALQMRNAGIGLTVGGVVSMFIIGMPCLFAEEEYDYDGYYHSEPNFYAQGAGIAFMAMGGAAICTGIPLCSVGASRMKKSQGMDLSLTSSANGLGVSLTF